MKILYIIESLNSGGKERRLVELIKGLLAKSDDVEIEIIVASTEIHYKEIFELNIPIHYLKRNILKDILLLSKFNKILSVFKPDIVHCWDNIAAVQFGPVSKLRRVKFVNSMITSAMKTHKFSKRYIANALSYPFSDVILSNSQAGLDNLFVPKNKQKVIYNGFDFDRLKNMQSPAVVKEKYNIADNKIIIGMVASFSDFKDYDVFFHAAVSLIEHFENLTFIALGDGINKARIEKAVSENKLNDYFIFTGRLSDVESIINIFNIGVLTTESSIQEGLSNSLLEYMALGKPVIATKGGGTPELVIEGETGLLIEPGNKNQLADKISFFINNYEVAAEMGKKGRERIEKYFSLDKMVSETRSLYQQLTYED